MTQEQTDVQSLSERVKAEIQTILETRMDETGLGASYGDAQEKRRKSVSTTITDDQFRLIEEIISSKATRYQTISDVLYEMVDVGLRSIIPLLSDGSRMGARILRRIQLLEDHVRENTQHFEMVELTRKMGDVLEKYIEQGDPLEAIKFVNKHLDILFREDNPALKKRYALTALESEKLMQSLKKLGTEGEKIKSRLLLAAKVRTKKSR